jgi:hypothetical protein
MSFAVGVVSAAMASHSAFGAMRSFLARSIGSMDPFFLFIRVAMR